MAPHILMTEEEVRQYFIINGGVVRNFDIVAHFKNYLANPNPQVQEDARHIFKAIVNKLATVRVDAGEKYLVLKRQYLDDYLFRQNQPLAYGGLNDNYYLQQPSGADSYFQQGYPDNYFQPQLHQNDFYSQPATYENHPLGLPQATSYPDNYFHQEVGLPTIERKQDYPVMNNNNFEYGLPPLPSGPPGPGPPSQIRQPQSPPPRQPPPYRPPPMPLGGNGTKGFPQTPPPLSQPPQFPSPQRYVPQQQYSGLSPPQNIPIFSNIPHGLPISPTSQIIPTSPTGSIGAFPQQQNQMIGQIESPISSHVQQQHFSPVNPRELNFEQMALQNEQILSQNKIQKISHHRNNSMNNLNTNQGLVEGAPPPPVPPRFKRSESMSIPVREDENKENSKDEKISVKERMAKFNRIASQSEIVVSPSKNNNGNSSKKNNVNKHDSADYDTSSLSSFGYTQAPYEPRVKEWILNAAKADYHHIFKMAQENPNLIKRKDFNTALHWAAKHGHVELIKLLAGTFKSDVNAKSNGGYTPLHLAAQFSRHDVYELLVQTYGADVNVRDYGGKKPMQYLIRHDTHVSNDTFQKIKDKRRESQQTKESFLRIGSLNVRVKKTTEALNSFLGKSSSSSSIERMYNKGWGSCDNIQHNEVIDKEMMPPPTTNGESRVRHKRNIENSTIQESKSDSDSDAGFGSNWTH